METDHRPQWYHTKRELSRELAQKDPAHQEERVLKIFEIKTKSDMRLLKFNFT